MSFLDSVKSFVSGNALLVGGIALVSLLALLVLTPILGRMSRKYTKIKKVSASKEIGVEEEKGNAIKKIIKGKSIDTRDLEALFPSKTELF